MRKIFQSGYAFLAVAFLFLIVAAVSESPAVYISLGAVFLILGLAVGRKKAPKPPEDASQA